MKHTSFLAGLLLVTAPLAALTIPGCGGGNGGIIGGNTPTPTSPAIQTSNLTLGNGQRAILKLTQSGTALTGTIQILASATPAKTNAINFDITVGTYTITGTVTPPRGYSIQGNFGTFGAFSMTGQLPTATESGSYSLTVNGQTDTGTVPPYSTSATPAPTSSGNYKLTGSLTFSDVSSGSDIVSTSISSFNDLPDGGTLTNANGGKFQVLALSGASGVSAGNGTTRTLGIGLASYTSPTNLKPFSVGQEIPLNIAAGSVIQLSQTIVTGTSIKAAVWRSSSGSVVVKAIGTNSISLELKNVHFDPTPVVGGKGSFDLKGTLSATGLTVKSS